jgi:hypothetical protein
MGCVRIFSLGYSERRADIEEFDLGKVKASISAKTGLVVDSIEYVGFPAGRSQSADSAWVAVDRNIIAALYGASHRPCISACYV